MPRNTPNHVELAYHIRRGRRAWEAVREDISLTRTACTFGARVWFVCPGCGERCAVLYGLAGRFRCRGCHHLAYPSTRVKVQRGNPERSPARPSTPRSSGGTRR